MRDGQLHQRLQEVQCPNSMAQCKDPMCTDETHSERRDSAVLDILFRVLETSYSCLPLTGSAGRGSKQKQEDIPGWTAEVEPRRQKSNYCYRVWLAGGKPRHGDLHRAKLDSHCAFRYAVRRVKRADKLQKVCLLQPRRGTCP